MATSNFVLDKGYDAGAAITKYRAVKFSAAETVVPVAASTDPVAGIAQYDVTSGEIAKGKGASVRVMGASEMEASAAIAVGALVSCDTSGRAKTAAALGERVIGICVEAAANAGDRIRVQLALPGYINTHA